MEGSAESERGFAAGRVVDFDGGVRLLHRLLVGLLLLGIRRLLVWSLVCGPGLLVDVSTIGLVGISAVVFRLFPKSFHPYQ
jgi:hypothetical protein